MTNWYIFKGGGHEVRIKVKDKELEVMSAMTRNRFVPLRQIFDANTIKQLYTKINVMADKEFDEYLVQEFQKMGYTLEKKI